MRETLACTHHHGAWYAADEDGFNNRIKDERADALAERYGHPYFDTEERRIPSIHMPRWASRILLEIISVRVARLNDISEEDARAEGITDGGCVNCGEPEPCSCTMPMPDARDSYCHLWGQINGPDSWAANPWVWCISFRRVQP